MGKSITCRATTPPQEQAGRRGAPGAGRRPQIVQTANGAVIQSRIAGRSAGHTCE